MVFLDNKLVYAIVLQCRVNPSVLVAQPRVICNSFLKIRFT